MESVKYDIKIYKFMSIFLTLLGKYRGFLRGGGVISKLKVTLKQ